MSSDQRSQLNDSSKLTIEPNDEYSFIVTGDTKPHKELFKQHGGGWRPNLGAWRFLNKNLLAMTELVNRVNAAGIPIQTVQKVESYKPVIGDTVIVDHKGKKVTLIVKDVTFVGDSAEVDTLVLGK